MKKIFLLTFFLFISSIFPINFACAQKDLNGFSIKPFFQEIVLQEERQKVEFNLEVSNQMSEPAVFRLVVLDFGALDESGGVAFLGAQGNLEQKYGLASWITLQKDAFVVNPGEKEIVKAFVENKESLSPGGHYAAILLKLEDEKNIFENNSPNISFKPSLASLIFARKIGGEIYNLNLKNWEYNRNIFWLFSDLKLRFQNSGNVYAIPRGVVKITDPFGRTIKKGIINEGSSLILPETFRVFPVTLKKTARALAPGRYEISVEYRYDGKDDFTKEVQKIYFLPLPLAVIFLIFIIGGGYFLIGKKWKKKMQAK